MGKTEISHILRYLADLELMKTHARPYYRLFLTSVAAFGREKIGAQKI